MTFLPDDSPFSECTDASGQAQAMAWRGGYIALTLVAPTGKARGAFLIIIFIDEDMEPSSS